MSRSTFSCTSKSAFLYSDSSSNLHLQRYPLCPFAGHALVYHAQVKEAFDSRHGNREKKDNPNFFVKAFRWYTQEHKVQKNKGTERNELDGFALWLDQKYDQFLYDSEVNNGFVSRLQILSSVRMVPNKPYNSSRRGRQTAEGRDGGDGDDKCHQSFEVILQPKELSRPASECGFQYRPTPCCISSKVTVASSDTVIIKKRSILKKASCEYPDNGSRVIPPEANIIQIKEKVPILSSQKISSLEETSVQNELAAPHTNVQCQCPEEHVVKMETSTQYEKSKLNSVAKCVETNVSSTSAARGTSQVSKHPAQVKPSMKTETHTASVKCACPKKDHVKIDTGTQYSEPEFTTVSAFSPCVCCGSRLHCNLETKIASSQKKRPIAQLNTESQDDIVKLKEKERDKKQVYEGTPIMQSSDTAQTSDHSIVLDNAATGGIPVLVRIVTRDRAIEDMQLRN